MNSTVTNTAAVAMSTASGGNVVMWLFQCMRDGHLNVPDQGTAILMAAFLFPVLHAMQASIVSRFNKAIDLPPAPVQPIPTP